ncbi:MAG: hypothetical protein HC824_15950 [Synechococcales cyanobacterium RM1_1_8]|nr:hypothetical protein [Synechococcales cyanobacterium RM1_1_8]
MNNQQLAPLLAWVAAKYAEELEVQFLQGPPEELWGRHVVWLFLLTKAEGVDARDRQAMENFLDGLSDETMAPARQLFLETVQRRLAVLQEYGQGPGQPPT